MQRTSVSSRLTILVSSSYSVLFVPFVSITVAYLFPHVFTPPGKTTVDPLPSSTEEDSLAADSITSFTSGVSPDRLSVSTPVTSPTVVTPATFPFAQRRRVISRPPFTPTRKPARISEKVRKLLKEETLPLSLSAEVDKGTQISQGKNLITEKDRDSEVEDEDSVLSKENKNRDSEVEDEDSVLSKENKDRDSEVEDEDPTSLKENKDVVGGADPWEDLDNTTGDSTPFLTPAPDLPPQVLPSPSPVLPTSVSSIGTSISIRRMERDESRVFRMREFNGGDDKDVESFIDAVDVTFQLVEDRYPDGARRTKAKLVCLSTYLGGDAFIWWTRLDAARKANWDLATAALREQYGSTGMRVSKVRLEMQKAQACLNNLQQGDMTCEKYLSVADELYQKLPGDINDRLLAAKFVSGITDTTSRGVVHGLLDDPYNYANAREAFVKATRGQRELDAQLRLESEPIKKNEDLTRTLIESMAKMMSENQKMMVSENQRIMAENQKIMAMFAQSLNVNNNAGLGVQNRPNQRGRGGGQSYDYSSNGSNGSGGTSGNLGSSVVCFGCGQRGHYRNECSENGRNNNRWGGGPNQGVQPLQPPFMAGGKPVGVHMVQQAEGEESSGTMGVRVAPANTVELVVIEEVAAAQGEKRGHLTSSGESRTQRPVGKKARIIVPEKEKEPVRVTGRTQPGKGNAETQDTEVSTKKRRRKRRNPLEVKIKPPRMMEGEIQWDYLQTIRDIPVPITFGQLVTVSPSVRAGIAYGMTVPRPQRKKGKSTPVEPVTIDEAGMVISEPQGEMVNFYTEGMVNGDKEALSKILVDGGSVVNLIPDRIARQYRLKRSQNTNLQIRTATGSIVPIAYCVQFDLTIAGVTANIKAYILSLPTTYNLLLGRRWMKQVGLVGYYREGTYEIEDTNGKMRIVPEYNGGEKGIKVDDEAGRKRGDQNEVEIVRGKGKGRYQKEGKSSRFDESVNRALYDVINQAAKEEDQYQGTNSELGESESEYETDSDEYVGSESENEEEY